MRKQYFLNFDIDRFMALELDTPELTILRWLMDFRDTNKMVFHIEGDDVWYWVKYSSVMENLRFLRIKSIEDCSLLFNRLCGNFRDKNRRLVEKENVNLYPLKRKIVKGVNGTEVYFAFKREGVAYLLGEDTEVVKNDSADCNAEIAVKSKFDYGKDRGFPKQKKEKKALLPKTYDIIKAMLDVENCPFKHRINDKDEVQSKVLVDTENFLMQLYSGTFLKNNSLDEKWLENKKVQYLDFYLENWDQIHVSMVKVMKHYGVFVKDKGSSAVTSLSSFFYNPRSKKSMLLTIISDLLHTDNEFNLDVIKKVIDERTRNIMEYYYQGNWDVNSFWLNMKQVYKYMFKYWEIMKDFNEEDWSFKSISSFMESYLQYCLDSNITSSRVIGLSGFAWINFVKFLAKSKNIEILDKESCETYKEKLNPKNKAILVGR